MLHKMESISFQKGKYIPHRGGKIMLHKREILLQKGIHRIRKQKMKNYSELP